MMMLSEATHQDMNNVPEEHLKSRPRDIAKIVTEILPQRLLSEVSSEYTATSSDGPCYSTAVPVDLLPGISPKIFADKVSIKDHLLEEPEHTTSETLDKNITDTENVNKNRAKKNKCNQKGNSNHKDKVVDAQGVNEKGDIFHQEDDLEKKVSKDKKTKHRSILGFHIGKVKIRFKKSMKKLCTSESRNNPLEGKGQDINELHDKNHDIVEINKHLGDTDTERSKNAENDEAIMAIARNMESRLSFYDVKSPSYTIMQQETKGLTPELYIRLSSEESASICGSHIPNHRSKKPSRQSSKRSSRRDSLEDASTRRSKYPTPRCSRRVIEPESKMYNLQHGSSKAQLIVGKRSSPDVGRNSRGALRKKWHLLNCCTPPRHNSSCCSTKCHTPSKCCTSPPKCYTPSKCCTPPPKCRSPPKCRTPPKCATPRCKQKCCQPPKCHASSSGCPRSHCCPTPSTGCSKKPCQKEKNTCPNAPDDCKHKFCKLMEAVAKVNSELDSSIGSRTSLYNPGGNDYNNLLGIEASTNNLVCELRKLLCILESKKSFKSGTAHYYPTTNTCPPGKPKCYEQRPKYSFCDGGQSNLTDIRMEKSCSSQDSTSYTGDTTAFSASTSVDSFNLRTGQPHPYGYDYVTHDRNDEFAHCTPPKRSRCPGPYVSRPTRAPRTCSRRRYDYEPPHFKASACGAHAGNYPPPCNYSRPVPKQDVCGRGRVVDIEVPLSCPVPTRKAACPGPRIIKQNHSCSCSEKRDLLRHERCYYVLWNGVENAQSGCKESGVPLYEQYSENSICDQLRSVLHALERNGKKLAQFDMSSSQLSKTELGDIPLNTNSPAETTEKKEYNKLNAHLHNNIMEWNNWNNIAMEKNFQRTLSFCELGHIPKSVTTQKESSYNETCSNYSLQNSHSFTNSRTLSNLSSHNSKIHPKVNIYNSILSNFCYEQTRNIYQKRNTKIPSKTKLTLKLRRFASVANATGLKKYLREILSMYDQPRDKSKFEQKESISNNMQQLGHSAQKKQGLTFNGQLKEFCQPNVEYCCGQQENSILLEGKWRPVCCTHSRHRTISQESSSPIYCCVRTRTCPQKKSSQICCHKSNSRTSLQQIPNAECCYQSNQRQNTTCCSQLSKKPSFQCRPIPLCCSRSKNNPNLLKKQSPTCCTLPKKKRSLSCCNKSKQSNLHKTPSPICCRQPKIRDNRPTPTCCTKSKQRSNLHRQPSPTCCKHQKKPPSVRQCPIPICCSKLKKKLILLQKQLSSTCCTQPKQRPDPICCSRPKPRSKSQNRSQKSANNDCNPIDISDCVNDIRCKILKLEKLLEKIESFQTIATRKKYDNSEEAALREYSERIRCDMLNILNKIERNKNLTVCNNNRNIQQYQETYDHNERRLNQYACKNSKMGPVDIGSYVDIINDDIETSKNNHICSNSPHHKRRAKHKELVTQDTNYMPYHGISSDENNVLAADDQNLSSIIYQKLSKLRNSINEKKMRRADDSNFEKQNHDIENDDQSQSSIAYEQSISKKRILNKPNLINEHEYSFSSSKRNKNRYEYSDKEDDECSIGSQTSRNTEMLEETQCSHDFLVQDAKDDPRIAFLPLSNDAEVNRSLREEITEGRSGTREKSNSSYDTNDKSQRSSSGHRVRYSDEDEVYYTNIGEKDTSCQCDLPCSNILEMSEDDLRQRCHGFTYDDLDTIYKRDIVKLKSKLTQVTSGFKFKKNRIESHLVPKNSTFNNFEGDKKKLNETQDDVTGLKDNSKDLNEKQVARSQIEDMTTSSDKRKSPFNFLHMILNLFKKSDEYHRTHDCNKCKSIKIPNCTSCLQDKFGVCKQTNRNLVPPAKLSKKRNVNNEKQTNQKCKGCGDEHCLGLGPPGLLPKPPVKDLCFDKQDKEECKENDEVECACKKKGGKVICECPAPLCPHPYIAKNKKKSSMKPHGENKEEEETQCTKSQVKDSKHENIKPQTQINTIDSDIPKQDKVESINAKCEQIKSQIETIDTDTDSLKQDTKIVEPKSKKTKPNDETESQTLDKDNKPLHVDACECFDCGCAGADDDNCNCTEEVPMDCSCTNEQSKGFKFTVLKNPGKSLCG